MDMSLMPYIVNHVIQKTSHIQIDFKPCITFDQSSGSNFLWLILAQFLLS